ncbi:hypothetical protein IWZ00DRAFT_183719 [Phyllosticta capitalensis]
MKWNNRRYSTGRQSVLRVPEWLGWLVGSWIASSAGMRENGRAMSCSLQASCSVVVVWCACSCRTSSPPDAQPLDSPFGPLGAVCDHSCQYSPTSLIANRRRGATSDVAPNFLDKSDRREEQTHLWFLSHLMLASRRSTMPSVSNKSEKIVRTSFWLFLDHETIPLVRRHTRSASKSKISKAVRLYSGESLSSHPNSHHSNFYHQRAHSTLASGRTAGYTGNQARAQEDR